MSRRSKDKGGQEDVKIRNLMSRIPNDEKRGKQVLGEIMAKLTSIITLESKTVDYLRDNSKSFNEVTY